VTTYNDTTRQKIREDASKVPLHYEVERRLASVPLLDLTRRYLKLAHALSLCDQSEVLSKNGFEIKLEMRTIEWEMTMRDLWWCDET